MASLATLSFNQNDDILTGEEGAPVVPLRTKRSTNLESEQLQLIEGAFACVQKLYDANLELNRELEHVRAKLSEGEDGVEKWQRLATTAVTRAKEVETQFSTLESRAESAERQLKAEKDRADAAEHRAAESQKAFAAYKEQFASAVQKYGQAQDIIHEIQHGAVRSVAGTHFRVVRKGTGWGD
jgi:Fe2+ transport system protein B